jgi:hypothetical protein
LTSVVPLSTEPARLVSSVSMFYKDTSELLMTAEYTVSQRNFETHFGLRVGPCIALESAFQSGSSIANYGNVVFHCSDVALDGVGKGEASAREGRKEQERS